MHIAGSIPFAIARAIPSAPPVQQLVAAHVSGKVNFEGVDVSNTQPLQLYIRSADRIEAATRVATGQQLDIQA